MWECWGREAQVLGCVAPFTRAGIEMLASGAPLMRPRPRPEPLTSLPSRSSSQPMLCPPPALPPLPPPPPPPLAAPPPPPSPV
eukprot:7962327-Pyramimonas_sp.AAC.1